MSQDFEINLSIPDVEIVSCTGSHWQDHWITGELVLQCRALRKLHGLKLSLWNPDVSTRYAGNKIAVKLQGIRELRQDLAMGEMSHFKLRKNFAQGEDFELSINSAVSLPPDQLDARDRALILVELSALNISE